MVNPQARGSGMTLKPNIITYWEKEHRTQNQEKDELGTVLRNTKPKSLEGFSNSVPSNRNVTIRWGNL